MREREMGFAAGRTGDCSRGEKNSFFSLVFFSYASPSLPFFFPSHPAASPALSTTPKKRKKKKLQFQNVARPAARPRQPGVRGARRARGQGRVQDGVQVLSLVLRVMRTRNWQSLDLQKKKKQWRARRHFVASHAPLFSPQNHPWPLSLFASQLPRHQHNATTNNGRTSDAHARARGPHSRNRCRRPFFFFFFFSADEAHNNNTWFDIFLLPLKKKKKKKTARGPRPPRSAARASRRCSPSSRSPSTPSRRCGRWTCAGPGRRPPPRSRVWWPLRASAEAAAAAQTTPPTLLPSAADASCSPRSRRLCPPCLSPSSTPSSSPLPRPCESPRRRPRRRQRSRRWEGEERTALRPALARPTKTPSRRLRLLLLLPSLLRRPPPAPFPSPRPRRTTSPRPSPPRPCCASSRSAARRGSPTSGWQKSLRR